MLEAGVSKEFVGVILKILKVVETGFVGEHVGSSPLAVIRRKERSYAGRGGCSAVLTQARLSHCRGMKKSSSGSSWERAKRSGWLVKEQASLSPLFVIE